MNDLIPMPTNTMKQNVQRVISIRKINCYHSYTIWYVLNSSKYISSVLHLLFSVKTGIDDNDRINLNSSSFARYFEHKLPAYSSNDRSYFIRSLSTIVQHTHMQSSIHHMTLQLLSRISYHPYSIHNLSSNYDQSRSIYICL